MNFDAVNRQYENQELDRHLAAQELDETCETCRLYHTPKCCERKQYNRDPGAADWCWGWRRKRGI